MTPKDILTNKNFCPMPWTGLMYNFDGAVKNCIRSSAPIGNIKDNSIQDILLGEHNTSTQTAMLNQEPGPRCSPCYELEGNKKSFDIISDRIFYIRELKTTPLDTYQVGNHNLQTIDVRWSNLCNFGCVYCSHEFSSVIANERKIFLPAPTDQQRSDFKNYIFEHAAKLKHVYMAGGEPLLMKENLELLDLLKKTNPRVNLRINTNLSKVDTRVFESICEFSNVHWIASAETMDREYEYIRFGGKWQDFNDNLDTIKKLDHKISFNMLHLLLNFKSLFDCVDYLKSKGFHNNSFIIGALTAPLYLNVRHLPESVLQSLEQTLMNRINESPGYLLEDSYRNLLRHIQQPFDKDLNNSFKRLQELDQLRNLNSREIFTDLYKLI